MVIAYQTVKMSVVYEILVDNDSNVFLFKNGRYFKPAWNVEHAKTFIS